MAGRILLSQFHIFIIPTICISANRFHALFKIYNPFQFVLITFFSGLFETNRIVFFEPENSQNLEAKIEVNFQ